MSRDAFPRLDAEYNEREERLDVARASLTQSERLMKAEALLRQALTLREIGQQGPFKSKVRAFLGVKS